MTSNAYTIETCTNLCVRVRLDVNLTHTRKDAVCVHIVHILLDADIWGKVVYNKGINLDFKPFIGNEIAPEEYVAIVIDIGDVTVTLGSPPLDDSGTKVKRECVSMAEEEQTQMKYQPDVIRKAGFDTAVLPPTAVK